MNFLHAVNNFFLDFKPGKTYVAIGIQGGGRRAIPLEWNQAKGLADVYGQPVFMIGSDGLVMREYHPKGKVGR